MLLWEVLLLEESYFRNRKPEKGCHERPIEYAVEKLNILKWFQHYYILFKNIFLERNDPKYHSHDNVS